MKFNQVIFCNDNQDSLNFTALESNSQISLNTQGAFTIEGLYYKINNGEAKEYVVNNIIALNQGDVIYFWNISQELSLSKQQYLYFNLYNKKYNVAGQLSSLTNNVIGEYKFYKLFYNCKTLISAKNLILFQTLAASCYESMFENCSSLVETPAFLVEKLVSSCYKSMFKGCTSLVKMPEFSADYLAQSCYESMFEDCTSLIETHKLHAFTLKKLCYASMFRGCTSLIQAPELPSYMLANNCYESMFENCTNLRLPPELISTNLNAYCYNKMFKNCKNLITTPKLSAVKMQIGCYKQMFYGCILIESAPELNSVLLANNCYESMFENCTNLVYLPNVYYSQNNLLDNYVENFEVGNYGTKSNPYFWDIILDNKYPNLTKWLKSNRDEEGQNFELKKKKSSFIKVNLKSNTEYQIDLYGNGDGQLYLLDDKFNLLEYNDDERDLSLVKYIFDEWTDIQYATSRINYHTPEGQDDIVYYIEISGFNADIKFRLSINEINELEEQVYFVDELINVQSDYLPADQLKDSCYAKMFKGCTSLVTAPELKSTVLAASCYKSMFENCTNLINPPELKATQLSRYCYQSMFKGCLNLIIAPELPSSKLLSSCYESMFENCTNLSVLIIKEEVLYSDNCKNLLKNVNAEGHLIVIDTPYSSPSSSSNMGFDLPSQWTINYQDSYNHDSWNEQLYHFYYRKNNKNDFYIQKHYHYIINAIFFDKQYYIENNLDYFNKLLDDFNKETFQEKNTNYEHNDEVTAYLNLQGNIQSLVNFKDHCDDYDYYYLFAYCEYFKQVHELRLPSINLGISSYEGMFRDCINIEKAPYLPAVQLKQDCYEYLFGGCSSLKYVQVEFLDWNFDESSTRNWLSGVDSGQQGLFKCHNTLDLEIRDESHIPATWTVLFYEDDINSSSSQVIQIFETPIDQPLTFMSEFGKINVQLIKIGDIEQFSLDLQYNINESGWHDYVFESSEIIIKEGDTVQFINNTNNFSISSENYLQFKFSPVNQGENIKVQGLGNIQSLLKYSEKCPEYSFYKLFENCNVLTTAPALYATQIKPDCYEQMFKGCTNLSRLQVYFVQWDEESTLNWVSDIAPYGIFIKPESLPSIDEENNFIYIGDSYIPEGWEIINRMVQGNEDVPPGDPLKFLVLEDNISIKLVSLSNNKISNIMYSINDDTQRNWNQYQMGVELFVKKNDVVRFWNKINQLSLDSKIERYKFEISRGSESSSSSSSSSINQIQNVEINGCVELSGELQSLMNFSKQCNSYSFYGLFENCLALSSIKNLSINALYLNDHCYDSLFRGCSNLTNIFDELSPSSLGNYCCAYMFKDCVSLQTTPLLSATTLMDYCYAHMFEGCSELKIAKSLPAKILHTHCYDSMFKDCKSLTTPPELYATKLAPYCYNEMFKGCKSLLNIPSLKVKKMEQGCYRSMFENCVDIVSIANRLVFDLQASMSKKCCEYMFRNCIKLQHVSTLNVSNLAEYCFHAMFEHCVSLTQSVSITCNIMEPHCCEAMYKGCTGLTSISALPATTLADYCYAHMYRDCTGLTSIPELPAIKLKSYCYANMFYGCKKLEEAGTIKAYYLADYCFYGMFMGCTSLLNPPGFNKADTIITEGLGTKEMPYNWYGMVDNSISSIPANVSIKSIFTNKQRLHNWGDGQNDRKVQSALVKIYLEENTEYCLELYGKADGYLYLLDDKFQIIHENDDILDGAEALYEFTEFGGDRGKLSQIKYTPQISGYYYLEASGENKEIECKLACTPAPVDKEDSQQQVINNSIADYKYCYADMFRNCTSLQNFPDFSATQMMNYGFINMFNGCIALTNAPTLHSTKLKPFCYTKMFYGCTSLVNSPALPATQLTDYCYSYMFAGCESLATIPSLLRLQLSQGSCSYMFDSCISLGSQEILDASEYENGFSIDMITVPSYSCKGMFNNCSSLYKMNGIGSEELKSYGYYQMFNGCSALTQIGSISSKITQSRSFYNMFNGCVSLKSVGQIYSDYVYSYTYQDMFAGCSNLSNIGSLKNKNMFAYAYTDIFNTCFNLSTVDLIQAVRICDYGYDNIFTFCQNPPLTSVGEIKAEIANNYCLVNMFKGCENLLNVGKINIESIGSYSLAYMFDGCTNLTSAPVLSATELAPYCYTNMFKGCESLLSMPELPATQMEIGCYYGMFNGCKGLNTIIPLQSLLLKDYCYAYMFFNCTSLTNYVDSGISSSSSSEQNYKINEDYMMISNLAALQLHSHCYEGMFANCTSLIVAPALPAEILVDSCYKYMFYGCKSLRKIRVGLNSWFDEVESDSDNVPETYRWVDGVSENGEFNLIYMNKFFEDRQKPLKGVSYIPVEWKITDIHSDYYMGENHVVGLIFDNHAYNNYSQVIETKLGVKYYLFYGNKFNEELDNNIKIINNGVFYAKNKLLNTKIFDLNLGYDSHIVQFDYCNTNILTSVFKTEDLINIENLQFIIQDNEYIHPDYINSRYFDLYCGAGVDTNQLKINLSELVSYLQLVDKKDYVCDDFTLSVMEENTNYMSTPYLNYYQIHYFPEFLTLNFVKNTSYINSPDKDINYEFEVLYNNVKIGRRFKIKKMEIGTSTYSASLDEFLDINPEDLEEFDYPYVWKNVNFNYNDIPSYILDDLTTQNDESQLTIGYDENINDYKIRLPFGKINEYRQSITISYIDSDSFNIQGEYKLVEIDDYNIIMGLVGTNSMTIDKYIDFKKLYFNQEKNYYLKAVHYSGSSYQYCVYTSDMVKSTEISEAIAYTSNRYSNPNDFTLVNQDFRGYINGSSRYVNYQLSKKEKRDLHGTEKQLFVRFTDEYGNKTYVTSINSIIYQKAPSDLTLRLVGSDGNTHYTGFYKKHDRFFPSEFITAEFSANSEIQINYELTGNICSDVEGDFAVNSTLVSKLLKIQPANQNDALLSVPSSNVVVKMTVTDEAGNENSISTNIRFINKLFRTHNIPLVQENTEYKHKLYAVEANKSTEIVAKRISNTEYTRSWNEIWYPETHGSPLTDKGEIDAIEALRIAKEVDETGVNGPTSAELLQYDRLALDATGTKLAVDDNGRYMQSDTGWNSDKTYLGMENRRINNGSYEKYWIIDNTGNVDFKLEFEIFDFSGQVTKLPANLVAPYDGDMLSVYDASDDDAINAYFDEFGNKKFSLKDSTKLKHLFTLKGSYLDSENNKIKVLDSSVAGDITLTGKGLITPSISQCSRICLIPFTDYGDEGSSVASGFKLKAGPAHAVEYKNYDANENTGEFWIHQSPETSSGSWSTCNKLNISYQYYASTALTDYEKGKVMFENRLNYPLTGTFVNYLYLGNDKNKDDYCELPYSYFNKDINITKFALTEDDVVDYSEPIFSVVPTGTTSDINNFYSYANTEVLSSGRLSIGYTLNKDTGIIEFLNPDKYPVPKGRIFANYMYHTYYRLTSDGYGDLFFYGSGILVPAAQTSTYSDWTYVDLKIVNEGTNTLQNGTLQFLARGYITKGSVVDTVLDNNRPWDVQQGTTAETVQRTGAYYSTDFSSLKVPSRVNAYNATKSQTCVFGTLEPKHAVYVRVFWCIANNETGTAWIDCTKGAKTYSAELSGLYYIFSS